MEQIMQSTKYIQYIFGAVTLHVRIFFFSYCFVVYMESFHIYIHWMIQCISNIVNNLNGIEQRCIEIIFSNEHTI